MRYSCCRLQGWQPALIAAGAHLLNVQALGSVGGAYVVYPVIVEVSETLHENVF
ncbi:hypothetical protein [Nostoc sp. 106C]|uniref:hypothetical protein n=1 Tax=Nostoc sp. 106C TaxID=1932667 RepID=UPI0014136BB5|nr:hypothetical protein [Nostoc sp. 106C]